MEIQWDAAARRPGLPHGEPSTQWARVGVSFGVASGLDRVDVRRLAARRREKETAPAPCTLDGHRLRAFTLVLPQPQEDPAVCPRTTAAGLDLTIS